MTLLTLIAILLFLTALLIARLGYFTNLANQDLYTTLSNQNWLDLVPVEPTRGLIYDRNGLLLAENVPIFSLDVLPYNGPDVPKTLAVLQLNRVTFPTNDIAQFQKQLKTTSTL